LEGLLAILILGSGKDAIHLQHETGDNKKYQISGLRDKRNGDGFSSTSPLTRPSTSVFFHHSAFYPGLCQRSCWLW